MKNILPKKYFLFCLLACFSVMPALAAETTLTFTTNDNVNWSDGIAEDGNGGSANIGGITIQISNVSDTSGTEFNYQLIHGHTELADGFFALTTYEPVLSNGSGWKGMKIQSSDLSEFQINGFAYWNYGEGSSIGITVKGYRDNAEVASTSFASTLNDFYQRSTVSLDSTFDNVDTVIFYSIGTSWHGINDIKIDDAVV